MTTPIGTRLRSRPTAFAVTWVLLAAAVGNVLVHDALPLGTWLDVPWPVIIPLYVLSMHLNLEFVRRGESMSITLTHLPLVLGLVLLPPLWHLVGRLIASALLSAYRRQDPLKFSVNAMLDALELSVAVAVVALVGQVAEPGPGLWAALFGGLLLGEALSVLAMTAILWLIGRGTTARQIGEQLASTAVTSPVFTAFGILTVAAAWTDPTTLIVVAGLAGAMAHGYRVHRRLSAQQQATEDLYFFVKDLGPIEVEQPAAVRALRRVRELMHARQLELHTIAGEDGLGLRLIVTSDGLSRIERRQPLILHRASADLDNDRMTTPVLSNGTVTGLLTASDRLGSERGFDMKDLRLLETVAAEFAAALDRGRLLSDLGLAARQDPLTGLPNLRQTAVELDELLLHDSVLVAAVAVDSFREVNDTLGHLVGDELLREVAARLQMARPEALIGRIGGGRFAVAVRASDAGGDASLFGLGLRSDVEGGVQLGAISTHVRLSVGCVRGPEHGADAATLLRRAETAMYSARHVHGGPVIWEPAYEVQGQRRLAVVMALREALASGAVGVAYQPKVLAATGQVVGVEALARWTHPALGSIAPDEFVPLAEAAGLMGSLTSTVMRQALLACQGWQRRGHPVGVAVNVSADTVLNADFVTEVSHLLGSVGIAPDLLTLELTEGVVVADPQLAAERMHELRAIGVRLSIDDFGTGYSSLTYLKSLPIDEVKIDKGFVAGLVDDAGDQAIVRAVVDIAHTMGITVVAEGVEQDDQQDLLRMLGVDELQGYLFARPMPTLGMSAWILREHASRS